MLPALLRRPVLPVALLLAAAACRDAGSAPTGPAGPGSPNPPGVPAEAIPLTINAVTGEVRVGRDDPEPAPDGLAYSMLGDDVVGVEAEPCTFSPVPGSNKLIRCTFGIRIANRLSRTELVTPTSFPRPPEGVDGVLVFPLLSGAIGSPGGKAVASPDWDGDPINFFNDVASCGRGADDCYRWERFDGPLAPGTTSERRVVGFDIPKSAQAVGVYLVVAADLLDDPEHTVALDVVDALSGEVASPSGSILQGTTMRVGLQLSNPLFDDIRSVMAFDLSRIPATATIRKAFLDFTAVSVHNGPPSGSAMLEHIDVGDALTIADHSSVAFTLLGGFTPGNLPSSIGFGFPAAVQSALDMGLGTAAFRIRFQTNSPTEQWFVLQRTTEGPVAGARLTVTYGYD